MAGAEGTARAVVLLTTWNRPALLAQSLPQIEREAARVGAQVVISDDRSSDPQTLELLADARVRGAEVLRRPEPDAPDLRVDGLLHADPRDAMGHLLRTSDATDVIARCAREARDTGEVRTAMKRLWRRAWKASYRSTQENNLSGFRHVIGAHPQADWILKIDDDVAVDDGAFAKMFDTWTRAADDGLDVWAVSGIRTPNEQLRVARDGYGITVGACNVAILYRADDWRRFLHVIPEQRVIDVGFDVAFARDYAPAHRPSAVPVCLLPSVVYHTGRNGLNVRDRDLNCDYAGDTDALVVR